MRRLVASVVLLSLLSPVEAAPRRCFGKVATMRGTKADEVFIGRPGKDVIIAGKGDDIIFSLSGSDRVCAGQGNDFVDSGDDFDRVRGGSGYDVCEESEATKGCEQV